MNTPSASGTLESLLYEYDPDETQRRSPMLQAMKLQLHISRSPSPDVTQVKPTRGDAVLLTFMSDGKNPEIANIAGNQVFDDDDDSIDDDDSLESEPEEEKMDKRDDGDCMDETPDSGTPVVPLSSLSSTASRTKQGEPPSLRDIMMGPDDDNSGRLYHRSCSLQALIVPPTTTTIPLHSLMDDDDNSIDPRSVQQNRTTSDYDDMVAVASAALSTAQQATSRPAVADQASRESSPNKYKSMPMPMSLLSLEDRKRSFGSDELPSLNSFVRDNGSIRSPPSNIQQYMIDSPQTLDSGSQLLTPASITTPQESAGMLARDDRSMMSSATAKESLVTPPAMGSPSEFSPFSFSPKGISSALPVPLPPIQPYRENCSAGTPSPASLSGCRENIQNLPSIHQLSLSPVSEPVVEDRLGVMASSPYGRSMAHPHGHMPATSAPGLPSLPSMASITQSQSPPISPHHAYRRDSDLASSNGNSIMGMNTNPYYGSSCSAEYGTENRHEPAGLGMSGLPSLSSRAHPSLAPAAAPAAMASTPVLPPPRRLSSDSLSSSKGERKMSSEMPPTTSHSTNHSTHANHPAAGSFKCRVSGCNAQPFQTQYLLNSHANVHSSDRPHYCSVLGCPRSRPGNGFKRKNEMIRHGLVHESPGYVCPFCQDREHKYPRPDNLQRHVRAHHREKPKDDPQLRDVLAQRPDGPNHRRRRRIV